MDRAHNDPWFGIEQAGHGRRFGIHLRLTGSSGRFISQFSQAEVQNFYKPVSAKHDVLRLNVPMDNAGVVCRGQG